MQLPILESRGKIIETVFQNQVTIVVGETGSGKTTQIPQYLYHAGFAKDGIIGITEPRRIAAISTAEFVAKQLKMPLGGLVGYQVRFDDTSCDGTQLKFMTDGILLREFQSDPDLRKYAIIVVDEAHERSQNIDFALGLLKNLLKRRKDLKVVVASATIDEGKFSRYFDNAPVINVSGRMFPVTTAWSEKNIPEEKMVDAVVGKVREIHEQESLGDILVFMTGQDTIHAVIEGLEELHLSDLVTIPVYAALSQEEQQKIFAAYPGKRKVVVATNIAETSITIDGIVCVVDSGLVKQSNFHPESGIESLDVVEHSQAGCEQRKGRAGRTQAGICYRMYTQENFQARTKFTEPEIRRTSLASVVLAMEDIGIKDIREFDFIDPPEKEAFFEAYETLIALGAILREKKGLTETGKSMARLPLEPRIARMLLEAAKHNCVKDVSTIAAFLSVRSIFVRPKEKEVEADAAHYRLKVPSSDALTFLKVWRAYEQAGFSSSWCFGNFLNAKALQEVVKIRTQLFEILSREGMELTESKDQDAIAKAVSVGLAYNLFEHRSRQWYRGVLRTNSEVAIHPSSAVFGNMGLHWVVACEIVRTTKVWARGCTAVKPEWLPDIAPPLYKFGEPILDSYTSGEDWVVAKKPVLFRDQIVGYAKSKITIPEAARIQQERIREATAKGMIALTFKKAPGLFGSLDNMVAELNGVSYKTWSHYDVEEEQTYYCTTEDFIGRKYARTAFKVFNLPEHEGEKATAASIQPSALDNLARHWGARLK
ncbi:MAG: ATP-dependent RNA helicase [bacterium]|nr:ATP-dependent RNA helicase [bacterium]